MIHLALKDRWVPIAILIYSFISGIVILTGIFPNLRSMLVLGLLLVCPGVAFVRWLHFDDLMTNLVLMIAISLGIDTCIAMLLMFSGRLTTTYAVCAVLAVTLLGVSIEMVRHGKEQGL